MDLAQRVAMNDTKVVVNEMKVKVGWEYPSCPRIDGHYRLGYDSVCPPCSPELQWQTNLCWRGMGLQIGFMGLQMYGAYFDCRDLTVLLQC